MIVHNLIGRLVTVSDNVYSEFFLYGEPLSWPPRVKIRNGTSGILIDVYEPEGSIPWIQLLFPDGAGHVDTRCVKFEFDADPMEVVTLELSL